MIKLLSFVDTEHEQMKPGYINARSHPSNMVECPAAEVPYNFGQSQLAFVDIPFLEKCATQGLVFVDDVFRMDKSFTRLYVSQALLLVVRFTMWSAKERQP